MSDTPQGPRPFATQPWRRTPTDAGHALAVAACRERIHAGDLFQANLCLRLSSRLSGEPIDVFAAAVPRLRPDRAALIAGRWGALVSLSPELFLERRGRRVRSAPIKGTRRRPADAALAATELDALTASDKDRAENTMIVDLMRNDFGRVCEPGSIEVESLHQARAHTGVWHLVSEVTGRLRPEIGDGELLRATFPPGSVTGAPKIAARTVIAELESTGREAYTGAIGFASPAAGLELSVAIRTFEFYDGEAWLGVGGGVVADSDPHDEAIECTTKARPLLDAIGAQLQADPVRATTAAPAPRRLSPRALPRPDPRAGVFETLLVSEGRPVALDRHLARLRASAQALYGYPVPADLAAAIAARAAEQVGPARVRVDIRPRARALEATIQATPLDLPRPPVTLAPATVPGGLGGHKWADRRLIDALSEALAPDQPLICDLDGNVLETARANIFIVERDGTLVTPPADGRILPGVTRARVIEEARRSGTRVDVRAVHLDRLAGASEVFVSGALGGIERVAAIAGQPTTRSAPA